MEEVTRDGVLALCPFNAELSVHCQEPTRAQFTALSAVIAVIS